MKDFDWEGATRLGEMQVFVGERRFQPWAQEYNEISRLGSALLGSSFFKWKEATVVLYLAYVWQVKYSITDQAIAAFLKKSPVSDSSTLLGKLALRKPEYQADFFYDRMLSWIGTERVWNDIDGDTHSNVMFAITNVLNYGECKTVKTISFHKYLSERDWMKGGVVSEDFKDMIPMGYSKTKTSLAATNSVRDIENRLMQNLHKEEFAWTLHAKPEPNKTRATIVDIFDLYIYVIHILLCRSMG